MASRRKRSKESSAVIQKDRGRGADSTGASHYLETSAIIEVALFILFTALLVIICFLGQGSADPRFIANHPAPERIVSEYNFTYQSDVLHAQQIRELRNQVPPVFQRTFEPFNRFKNFIGELNAAIARTQIELENETTETINQTILEVATASINTAGYQIDPEALLHYLGNSKDNRVLLMDSIVVLNEIYTDGIYSKSNSDGSPGRIALIQIVDEEGNESLPRARSLEDAEIRLRVQLNALTPRQEDARRLFKIVRQGLEPNLLYSSTATESAISKSIEAIEKPTVEVTQGDTIIEPGALVNSAALEALEAYRKVESDRENNSVFTDTLFLTRTILTLILLLGMIAYIKSEMRETKKRNRTIAVTALAILVNLLIIRGLIEIDELAFFTQTKQSLHLLNFGAPVALAPIIVAVLVGIAPGIATSLIVSVLYGVMNDNSIPFFVIAFISGISGSLCAVNVRKRGSLVRAGVVAGVVAGVAGAMVGLLNEMTLGLATQLVLGSALVGLLTGVTAVGLIPVLEHLFKISTEITLLELTDFNHRLLRRMQVEAPGTYHHSLMVANLSENAASAIGASPLLCRACSLFHDIGKLVKPEYFTENQRDGSNPHHQQNPSMSALVIKAHVKEGVEMARKNRLPRVIIDVIRQHHGTCLIHYFYHEARKRSRSESKQPFPNGNGGDKAENSVDESTYRYDGPRPRFKESAIIFFADSCEAASRSLKKVSQPAIKELLDTIFQSRIEDGQLDECPLTFHELAEIKRSFEFTLLNMLHSRIEYPKEESGSRTAKPTAPKPAAEPDPAEAAKEATPEPENRV